MGIRALLRVSAGAWGSRPCIGIAKAGSSTATVGTTPITFAGGGAGGVSPAGGASNGSAGAGAMIAAL
jgi:hypothetical protein